MEIPAEMLESCAKVACSENLGPGYWELFNEIERGFLRTQAEEMIKTVCAAIVAEAMRVERERVAAEAEASAISARIRARTD